MNPASTILTEAEIEDFEDTLHQYRYEKEDFQLTENPAHELTGKQQNIHFLGEVSVRRISNGNEMTYRAGPGLARTAYFQDDLKHGTFGHH
ncbi:hypothetical protein ACFL9T_19415 [Thermodesulfobacteriota bacterium]